MNLQEYKFEGDGFETDTVLLQEAHDRGFYNGHTPYNKLFSDLFFKGGNIKFKEGLDEAFLSRAVGYLHKCMRSFASKHQEKEAVSSLILSEVADIDE